MDQNSQAQKTHSSSIQSELEAYKKENKISGKLGALQTAVAEVLKTVFDRLAVLGPANFLYSDGDYLYVYANKRTQPNGRIESPGMYYFYRSCAVLLPGVQIEEQQSNLNQHIMLFASVPLSSESWIPLGSNQLVVAKGDRAIRKVPM
jgi:hypothetical protein